MAIVQNKNVHCDLEVFAFSQMPGLNLMLNNILFLLFAYFFIYVLPFETGFYCSVQAGLIFMVLWSLPLNC